MTLKEKVAAMQPDCIDDCYDGGVYGCPAQYPYLNRPELGNANCSSSITCKDCWNQIFVDNSVDIVRKYELKIEEKRQAFKDFFNALANETNEIKVISEYEAAMNYLFKKSVEEDAEKDILITLQTALNYAHEKGKV